MKQEFDFNLNKTINVTKTIEIKTPIYKNFTEEGVNLGDLIARNTRAIYELKQENDKLKQALCKIDTMADVCK
jgi:hypothetical protein